MTPTSVHLVWSDAVLPPPDTAVAYEVQAQRLAPDDTLVAAIDPRHFPVQRFPLYRWVVLASDCAATRFAATELLPACRFRFRVRTCSAARGWHSEEEATQSPTVTTPRATPPRPPSRFLANAAATADSVRPHSGASKRMWAARDHAPRSHRAGLRLDPGLPERGPRD